MSLFGHVYQHLLPRSIAWLAPEGSQLRQLLDGLAAAPDGAREELAAIGLDLYPGSTRELDLWERQFGLFPGSLTEAQRRVRLALAWSQTGGQSPRFLQDTLRANGFDVFVHEWWDPIVTTETVEEAFALVSASWGDMTGKQVPAEGLQNDITSKVNNKESAFLRFDIDVPKGAVVRRAKLICSYSPTLTPTSAGRFGLGILLPDGKWEDRGFGVPDVYEPQDRTPYANGPDSDTVIFGKIQNDAWTDINSFTLAQLPVNDGDPLTFGSRTLDPTILLTQLVDGIQQWIESPSYVQGGPIGFVISGLDSPDGAELEFRSQATLFGDPPTLLLEWETGFAGTRKPSDVLHSDGFIEFSIMCTPEPPSPQNDPLSQCGEALAQAGQTDVTFARGYLLVNKINTSKTLLLGCGDPELLGGDTWVVPGTAPPTVPPNEAFCGQADVIRGRVLYEVPAVSEPVVQPPGSVASPLPVTNPQSPHPYFSYIGGEAWPLHAQVPQGRREEFEDLCLKIFPAHQWLGMLIDY